MDELRYVLLTSGVEIVGSAEEVASRGTLGTARPLPGPGGRDRRESKAHPFAGGQQPDRELGETRLAPLGANREEVGDVAAGGRIGDVRL